MSMIRLSFTILLLLNVLYRITLTRSRITHIGKTDTSLFQESTYMYVPDYSPTYDFVFLLFVLVYRINLNLLKKDYIISNSLKTIVSCRPSTHFTL